MVVNVKGQDTAKTTL